MCYNIVRFWNINLSILEVGEKFNLGKVAQQENLMKNFLTQDWTAGDLNALVKNLGNDVARKIQKGESFSVQFKEIIQKLFDKNGRRIPKDLSSSVCDPDKNFNLSMARPETIKDFSNVLSGFTKLLGVKDLGITAEEFKAETERLLSLITGNDQIANIKNGTYLPLVLPKLESGDLGTALEQYLEIVGKSYKKAFRNRNFCNYRKGELSGVVKTVEGSRQDQLIEKMKQGPVVIIFFPNSLQGFSVDASREQMETLPEGFILSGIETIIAMIMYSEVLARDYQTPGLDLAGLSWRSPAYSLHFKSGDDRLDFVRRGSLSGAGDNYSSGLSFLG